MLTVGGEGDPGSEEEALMVFSFEEEVKMFLRFGKVDGDGWRMRESGAGELVSVLSGPCQDVERVALDPMPEMLAEKVAGTVAGSTLELVSMNGSGSYRASWAGQGVWLRGASAPPRAPCKTSGDATLRRTLWREDEREV